jgi:hypothetical protein
MGFDIPVVLLTFRRKDTVLRILERIAAVKPTKIYLISDGPRNDIERKQVDECRAAMESGITWDCTLIRDYSDVNKGVLDRIGLGAKRVFSSEEKAIFLEDDNLPEVTFFEFCREMLEKWEDDSRVLWVCGTNYLGEYSPDDGSSYMFTKHLLPCGWASWSKKYHKYYDEHLRFLDYPFLVRRMKKEYENQSLYKQQLYSFRRTRYLVDTSPRSSSWDYQMAFAVRVNNLYGISPGKNQIRNIGVDNISEHGGKSVKNVMVRRFTGMDSYPIVFPLVHPKTVLTDIQYEKRIGNIILLPWYLRVGLMVSRCIKAVMGWNKYESIKVILKEKMSRITQKKVR